MKRFIRMLVLIIIFILITLAAGASGMSTIKEFAIKKMKKKGR